MESHLRIIILAAGSSERMGKPKLLLPYQGRSLIVHSVSVANEIKVCTPIVVTGSYDELIRKELKTCKVEVVFNPDWKTGMASSIKTGLYLARQDSDLESVLITVADQPFVSAKLYSALIKQKLESQNQIIACRYEDGTVGVPVLFSRSKFSELLNLKGEEGARILIRNYHNLVDTVDFPSGGIDIDTIEDFNKLASHPNCD
jgi:molybdenum cofactor cytidylyltransferase